MGLWPQHEYPEYKPTRDLYLVACGPIKRNLRKLHLSFLCMFFYGLVVSAICE